MLARADGDPVSYEALRNAGVEYPASVASELELVGVRLERPFHPSGATPEPLGVRLAPQRQRDAGRPRYPPPPRAAPREARARAHGGVLALAASIIHTEARAVAADARRVARGARSLAAGAAERVAPALHSLASGPRRRLLPPAALLAAAVIVAALVVADLAGSAGSRRHAPLRLSHANASISRASQADRSAPLSPPNGAATTPTTSATESAQTPASPRQASAPPAAGAATHAPASQLETEGHALLASGQAARAIPVLRSAIAATGQTLDRCLEPSGEPCLTYAYALYDLGTALRLAGHNADAVPVLEQRLQIANQRGTVRRELRLARGPRGASGDRGE